MGVTCLIIFEFVILMRAKMGKFKIPKIGLKAFIVSLPTNY